MSEIETSPAGEQRERSVPCQQRCGRQTFNHSAVCDECRWARPCEDSNDRMRRLDREECHELHIEPQSDNTFYAQCSCGLAFGEEAAADRHAEASGWCGTCWGSGSDPYPSLGICPACKGTGEADPLRGLPSAEYPNGRPSATLPVNAHLFGGE